jgi:hypothetical protein
MNNYAVSSGLFLNGHRNSKNIKAMGNIYFIDIDREPKEKENPYYLEIEKKLKKLNISFVSVPSKSADKYPYKRHIAIILDNNLPTTKEDYQRVTNEIINKIGIDLNKIDSRVKENQTSFLAPCIINKDFKNYENKSYFYNGMPLQIEESRNIQLEKSNILKDLNISPHISLVFSNGDSVRIFNAYKLVEKGESAGCYCPFHDDKKPSATYYHNKDGSVNINCNVCGNIPIFKNNLYNKPKINHSIFNYSIVIEDKNKKIENDLKKILGIQYLKKQDYLIWSYEINSMEDIYFLMLGKIQLINDGYVLLNHPTENRGVFADKELLRYYSRNTKPLFYFVNQTVKKNPFTLHKIMVRSAVRKRFIFPELDIYAVQQTYLNINSTEEICNMGLGHFEYVLNTIEKEKDKINEYREFPVNLDKKERNISDENREIKRMKTVIKNMSERQKKIYKLRESGKYNKANGTLNKRALAEAVGITRPTLDADLKIINDKN